MKIQALLYSYIMVFIYTAYWKTGCTIFEVSCKVSSEACCGTLRL
jgi:hypothetical protein